MSKAKLLITIISLTINLVAIITAIPEATSTNPLFDTNVARTDKSLSVYLYPSDISTDPFIFAKNIAKLQIIPGDIIIKFIDIDSNGNILTKDKVYNSMVAAFPKEKFTYSAMINGANFLNLSESKANEVINVIKSMLPKLTAPFQAVSIDVEPVFSKSKKYNDYRTY